MTTKEIIELFASILGSLATAVACIIALWQTKLQIRRKLKLKSRTIVQNEGGNIQVFLGLDIINIGYMKVIIREWCVPVKKGKKLILIPEPGPQEVHLPYELEPGEGVCLLFYPENFKKKLKELESKSLLKHTSSLRFDIVDSVDNVYSIKIPPTNEWLANEKNKENVA